MTDRQKKILLILLVALPAGGLAAFILWRMIGGKKSPLTDAAVIDASAAALTKWEGSFGHLYLDTKGLPTTGVGNLVAKLPDVAKLPWNIGGALATPAQIARDFAAVTSAAWGRPATFYAGLSKIRLSGSDVANLLKRRLARDYLPALHSRFPTWDKLPGPAQIALVDMMYSLGPGAFDKYKTMTHAVQRGDFRAAALASQRNGARQSRNDYVRDLFYEASGAKAA